MNSIFEYILKICSIYHLHIKEFSDYIVADAYFSKTPFLNDVLSYGLQLISRLRDDARLQYFYRGEQNGKKRTQ